MTFAEWEVDFFDLATGDLATFDRRFFDVRDTIFLMYDSRFTTYDY